MGIRRIGLLISALLLAGAATAPAAGAKPLTALVVDPYWVNATIYNNAPPSRPPLTDIRIYIDEENFTVSNVTASSNNMRRFYQEDGLVMMYVVPGVTTYTINGVETDFAGAMIEGCSVYVEGTIVILPAPDLPVAQVVETTCP